MQVAHDELADAEETSAYTRESLRAANAHLQRELEAAQRAAAAANERAARAEAPAAAAAGSAEAQSPPSNGEASAAVDGAVAASESGVPVSSSVDWVDRADSPPVATLTAAGTAARRSGGGGGGAQPSMAAIAEEGGGADGDSAKLPDPAASGSARSTRDGASVLDASDAPTQASLEDVLADLMQDYRQFRASQTVIRGGSGTSGAELTPAASDAAEPVAPLPEVRNTLDSTMALEDAQRPRPAVHPLDAGAPQPGAGASSSARQSQSRRRHRRGHSRAGAPLAIDLSAEALAGSSAHLHDNAVFDTIGSDGARRAALCLAAETFYTRGS